MNSAKASARLKSAYEHRSSLKRHEFIGLMRDAGVDVRPAKGGDVVLSYAGEKVSMNGHTRNEIGYGYFKPIVESLRLF